MNGVESMGTRKLFLPILLMASMNFATEAIAQMQAPPPAGQRQGYTEENGTKVLTELAV